MKKVLLTIIFLIAGYTLIRNNVYKLLDQSIWLTNPDLFFKTIIPFLLMLSALVAFLQKQGNELFSVPLAILFIDAVNRLAIGVNFLFLYFRLPEKQLPPLQAGATRDVLNLWPSHIMLIMEITVIVLALKHIINIKLVSKSDS